MVDIKQMKKYVQKYSVERNQPCLCGSGKKYKKCCEPYIDERQKNISKTPDYDDLAIKYLNKKQYAEAELYFRAHLTQYIIWYNEQTKPFYKEEPEAAKDIYLIDIDAINEIADFLVKALYRQNKIKEIHHLYENLVDIIDNSVYRFYIDTQRAYWLDYDKMNDKAVLIMDGYLNKELDEIPLTYLGIKSLVFYLYFLHLRLPAVTSFKILDKLLRVAEDYYSMLYFLTQKARIAFMHNDTNLAKTSAEQLLKELRKISSADISNSREVYALLPDTYQMVAIILNDDKYYRSLIEICEQNILRYREDKKFLASQYHAIGQAYTSLKKLDKAKESILKSLALDKRDEYQLDLVKVFLKLEEQKSALKVLNEIKYDKLEENLKIDYLSYFVDVALTNKDKNIAVQTEKKLANLRIVIPYFQMMTNDFRSLLLDFICGKYGNDTLIIRLKKFAARNLILQPNFFGIGINLNEILVPKDKGENGNALHF
ncbi:MAG: hypothetical protein CVU77_06440 [Elusimicrobia bacterium HGW-Elusimicrobia-1]|jgi:hypothetical protein|nr:MAG: hypothetical protein CVU77_06440 [Elusimicrobia bacterium HGW-Elusimicrobia-1]